MRGGINQILDVDIVGIIVIALLGIGVILFLEIAGDAAGVDMEWLIGPFSNAIELAISFM